MTRHLATLGQPLTLVEGSESFCHDLARQFPDAEVVHALFENFAPKARFANIVLGHVLEHVVDPAGLLARMRDWLEPEGRLLAAVPNARSLHRQAGVVMGLLPFEEALNDLDRHHGHRRVYNPETFRRDVLAAGFTLEVFGGYGLKILLQPADGRVSAGAAFHPHDHRRALSRYRIRPLPRRRSTGMSPQAITSRDLEVALHEFVVRARLEASAQTPGLLASKPPQDGLSSLVTLRLDILQMLLMADPSVVRSLLSHAAFRERALLIATGLLFEPREGLPEELFAEIRKVYSRSWDQANWINLFACAQLCFQPFELPPHPDPDSLPDDVFSAYLDYCLTTPAFFQLGDDTRYVAHIGQMIRLLTLSLETTNPLPRRLEAFRFATTVLNLNALTHVDVDVRDTLAARGELIERLNLMGRDTQDVETALPARSTDLTLATKRRIRIGFYVRTILFGPDTNVLWSDICRLDPARYEVILYSSDSYDRSYIP